MVHARKLYSCGLALFLLSLGSGGASAQEPSPHERGSIHIGTYEALTTKAHVKLWFGRYTVPAILAEADVAYIYQRTDYCASPTATKSEDFYSDRYALARKVVRGYEVDDLLQIKKVGFCASDAAGVRDLAVVTKTSLSPREPTFVINWSAGESIGGIAAPKPNSLNNSDDPPNDSFTSQHDLDARFLTTYTDTLRANGIEIRVAASARRVRIAPTMRIGTYPPSSSISNPGLLAAPMPPREAAATPNAMEPPAMRAIAPPPAPPPPQRYCLNIFAPPGTSVVRTCSNDFATIAEKLPTAVRKKPEEQQKFRLWSVKSVVAPAEPAPTMKFALEIN